MNGNALLVSTLISALCAAPLGAVRAAGYGGAPSALDSNLEEAAATDSKRYDGASRKTAAAPDAKAGQVVHDMRISQLLGKEVRNPQGQHIGEIQDLFVDLKAGQARYAVLTFDGSSQPRDKLFAFPMTAFKLSQDRGELVLDVGQEKLKNMPGFSRDTWPDYESDRNGYFGAVDRFFNGDREKNGTRAARGMMRASELLGRTVNDRNGKKAGEVQDVVADVARGRLSYVVLDFDKAWSLDNKLLPLPLGAFTLPKQRGDALVINVSRDRLNAAHGFERNKWPDLNSPAYRATTRDYFLALERPVQSKEKGRAALSGDSGDSGVSGGIYADPATGASVPRERDRPRASGAVSGGRDEMAQPSK